MTVKELRDKLAALREQCAYGWAIRHAATEGDRIAISLAFESAVIPQ